LPFLGALKAEVIFVLGMVYVIETKTKIKEEKETTQSNTQASIAHTNVVYNVFLVAFLLGLPLFLYKRRKNLC
jgi:hypothetical protein